MITYNKDTKSFEMKILGYTVTSVYQDIKNGIGEVYAYEALCRVSKDNNNIHPKKFFSYLSHLDDELEFRVKFSINLMHIKGFVNSSIYSQETKLFINLTPCFFTSVHNNIYLLDNCTEEISRLGIRMEQIVAEIVEDYCPISNIKSFYKGIELLRGKGVSIAIDDFGTGHSGFSRIAAIKPDYIKVSRELLIEAQKCHLEELEELEELKVICEINKVTLIFEGIECSEQLKIARIYGSTLYQGYYLARPKRHPTKDLANYNSPIERLLRKKSISTINITC
ncbi:EAL domain-containing protein [Vibrio splendidus]|uniref:EAL domain-containing protein n=1 Tax=Vibrio splendidus TaxID=29497 RepID=UPI00031BAF38|nr:EAL domain-containing protein [Vibrio splendidus]